MGRLEIYNPNYYGSVDNKPLGSVGVARARLTKGRWWWKKSEKVWAVVVSKITHSFPTGSEHKWVPVWVSTSKEDADQFAAEIKA